MIRFVLVRTGRAFVQLSLAGLVLASIVCEADGAGPGAAVSAQAAAWTPEQGIEMLGCAAPEWQDIEWVQGGPLSLSQLRGKVVLVRWWLHDCIHCSRTAPALNDLWSRYRGRGLVVVGLHHPKADLPSDRRTVRAALREKGFEFPIGLDNSHATLKAYGYGTRFTRFSSLSFVIDREGIIRFVHDGGEYHSSAEDKHHTCDLALGTLQSAVVSALQD
jgi:peroxiredoxin